MDFSTICHLYEQFLAYQDVEYAAAIHDQLQQDSVIETLRQKLEDTYNPQMRQTVVDILALIGTPPAMALVEHALDDINSNVRIAAIEVMRDHNRRDLVPKLIGILLGDRSSYVRKYAAIALGDFAIIRDERFNDPRAIHALLEALAADENSYVRYEAALSLGKIADPGACLSLSRALINDENSYVRWACATALEKMDTADRFPALLASLFSDNPHIRRAAEKALTRQPDATTHHLKQAMSHDTPLIRALALAALMKLSEPHILIDQPGDVRGFWN